MYHPHHPWKAKLGLCMNKTTTTSLAWTWEYKPRQAIKLAKLSHQTQVLLIKPQSMCKRKHEVVNCMLEVMRKTCSMCSEYKPNTSKYTKNTWIRVNAKYHKKIKFRSLLESKWLPHHFLMISMKFKVDLITYDNSSTQANSVTCFIWIIQFTPSFGMYELPSTSL